MRIKFFEGKDGFMDERAVNPGVYIVKLAKRSSQKKPINLYIGESYSMAQRCGRHLYETLIVNPEYFGLTKELVEDDDLELIFEVLVCVKDELWSNDKGRDLILKNIEKEQIKELGPIIQYSTSDRVLPERKKKVEDALKDL